MKRTNRAAPAQAGAARFARGKSGGAQLLGVGSPLWLGWWVTEDSARTEGVRRIRKRSCGAFPRRTPEAEAEGRERGRLRWVRWVTEGSARTEGWA